VRLESACSLQSQWEEKVLQEVQGTSDPQMIQYLLGPEGPVWKYVKGPAGPFIGWTPQRGYYSKAALGGSVSFDPSFFAFLTKGAKAKITATPVKQSNNVIIKGLPTDANADARIKPQSTQLELQCVSGPQFIENMNFPVSKTFVWAPDSCSDVSFQIDVGEVMLIKKYVGPQGFPAFLQDFPGGRHTFYPQNFPREKAALERMGIKYIRVNYQFIGAGEIMSKTSAGTSLPRQVPKVVCRCWN
jgi:type VI secretion system protein ImpL